MDSAEKKHKLERRTWYGLNGTIVLEAGFLHRSGFGKLLIPHPPVVNWLLRQGLEDHERVILSLAHEFGHLQTAPFALLYVVVILILALNVGHRSAVQVLFLLTCAQAAWEIASEFYTIRSDLEFYKSSYSMVFVAPRLLFWVLNVTLAATGWLIAVF